MMALDQKLDRAAADVRQLVEDLDVPPLEKPRISWVLAVAAAMVVAVVAFVLLRVTADEADVIEPSPNTVPVPTTTFPPTTVPPGPDSAPVIVPSQEEPFNVETAIGTWTWTPIDVWSQYPPLPEVFVDGTYLSADGNDLLVSDDGLSWVTVGGEPPWGLGIAPRENAHLFARLFADGDAVYAAAEAVTPSMFRTKLFRYDAGSAEFLRGDSWTEIVVPEVTAPEVEGLALVTVWPSIDVFDNTVIVVFDSYEQSLFGAEEGQGRLTEPYGLTAASPIEGGLIEILDTETNALVALIGVEVVDGEPPRIEFRDLETDGLVHAVEATLPGLTPEQLVEAILNQEPVYRAVFVSTDEGGFEEISVPWRGDVHITSINGELLALDGIDLWSSSDGLSWSRVATTGLELQTDTRPLSSGGERVFLPAIVGGDVIPYTTSNGRDWQVVDDLRGVDLQRVESTSFGWFAVAEGFGVPLSIFVSEDGLAWQDAGSLPSDSCEVSYVSEAIFANCFEEDGSFARWTATLDTG